MQISLATRMLLRRSLVIQAAGAALAVGGAAYYFTHPQRVASELPEDLKEVAQSVTLTASDGARLHATWIPGERTIAERTIAERTIAERTIVHHHGYNSCGGVLLARRALFQRAAVPLPWTEQPQSLCAWPVMYEGLQRGYNFLLVDARAHGQSDGPWDPSGALAVADAAQWARWLRETYTQLWVGLWGHSFGAAVGLGLALRPSGGGYDAMVLDSPVLMSKGVYSGVVAAPLYAAIQPVLQRVGNHTLYPSLQAHRPWMPILLIHGVEDGHVPAWQSEVAYELIRDPDDGERSGLWLVPGARHLQALEVAPEEYVRRTLDWFDKWM